MRFKSFFLRVIYSLCLIWGGEVVASKLGLEIVDSSGHGSNCVLNQITSAITDDAQVTADTVSRDELSKNKSLEKITQKSIFDNGNQQGESVDFVSSDISNDQKSEGDTNKPKRISFNRKADVWKVSSRNPALLGPLFHDRSSRGGDKKKIPEVFEGPPVFQSVYYGSIKKQYEEDKRQARAGGKEWQYAWHASSIFDKLPSKEIHHINMESGISDQSCHEHKKEKKAKKSRYYQEISQQYIADKKHDRADRLGKVAWKPWCPHAKPFGYKPVLIQSDKKSKDRSTKAIRIKA